MSCERHTAKDVTKRPSQCDELQNVLVSSTTLEHREHIYKMICKCVCSVVTRLAPCLHVCFPQAELGRALSAHHRGGYKACSHPLKCFWGGPFRQINHAGYLDHFAARLGPVSGVWTPSPLGTGPEMGRAKWGCLAGPWSGARGDTHIPP